MHYTYNLNNQDIENELDETEILFFELNNAISNIYKLALEDMGYDLGYSKNNIEYRNYYAADESVQPILIDNMNDGGDFSNMSLEDLEMSPFINYTGEMDGSIGSKDFPQGKGKAMDPHGLYWPFKTFGFGASPSKRPERAFSKRSGVDCCKLAVNTIMNYLNKGCKTIGDVICMYHAGMPTYTSFIKHYSSIKGINDIADGRFVSSAEMIKRQNYYQQHLVDYVHMPNTTPVDRSYKVLFPLITFISRQEQGVNSEAACKIALKEMGIT